MLGVHGTNPPPPPTALDKLRARFRARPCQFGWHQHVLTNDGSKVLKMICEHCGDRKAS